MVKQVLVTCPTVAHMAAALTLAVLLAPAMGCAALTDAAALQLPVATGQPRDVFIMVVDTSRTMPCEDTHTDSTTRP